GDPRGPTGPGRDDPVGLACTGETVARRFSLAGDDRALVGEREARRGGVDVERNHMQVGSGVGSFEEPELARTGA
ncbi:MAG: hypothetical protein ACR2HI_04930, partial [Gaiella sp.]